MHIILKHYDLALLDNVQFKFKKKTRVIVLVMIKYRRVLLFDDHYSF